MVKFTWKIRNRLNREKNKYFQIFIFRVVVIFRHFCFKNCKFSMNFHDNSKNKSGKIVFSFVSGHCASFMKVGSKLRGGGGAGLHILTWDRAPCCLLYMILKYRKNFLELSSHEENKLPRIWKVLPNLLCPVSNLKCWSLVMRVCIRPIRMTRCIAYSTIEITDLCAE